jgi:hypothetical protein
MAPTGLWCRLVGGFILVSCEIRLEDLLPQLAAVRVEKVADEPVGGRAVVIDLSVRRLYCENPECPKTTFAEQVTGLTVRYHRRTRPCSA